MSNKRIKLLLVYPSSDLAGVAQYILSIVRYLPHDKFEIHAAVFGNGPLCESLAKEHVSVHRLRTDYTVLTFLYAVFSLRRFLKQVDFDILHAHTTKAGLLCSVSKKGLRVKTVYTGHCFRFSQKRTYLFKALFLGLERFICGSSDFITVLGTRDYDLGVSKDLISARNSEIVRTSIDVDRFLPPNGDELIKLRTKLGIPPHSKVVGMVGRLALPRDPETFVKAAAILNSRLRDTYFMWVGDGELRSKLMRYARNLDISDRIVITGWQDMRDIPNLLLVMDVIFHVTRIESISVAILEAMAAGKPIVAPNIGGFKEIIEEGRTGWLFEVGDFEKAASILEHVLTDQQQSNAVGKAAFQFVVDQYSPKDRMSKRFQEIYEHVVC